MKQTLLHGLFPVVRAEVLRLLFTNVRQELYTRQLARLSFLALRTVQDEVAKLESANLILSRSNGYHRFYRANPRHPLPALFSNLCAKLRRIPRRSRECYPAGECGARKSQQHSVFGSMIRNCPSVLRYSTV
jgi:hypothetical protein